MAKVKARPKGKGKGAKGRKAADAATSKAYAGKAPARSQAAGRDSMLGLLDALSGLRFGGEERALDNDIGRFRDFDKGGGGLDQAYALYQQELDKAKAAQGQAFSQAAGQIGQVAAAARGTSTDLAARQSAEAAHNAQVQGLDPTVAQKAITDSVDATTAGTAKLADAGAGAVASAGLAGANYLGALGQIGVTQKAFDHGKTRDAINELLTRKRDLQGEKGMFRVATAQQLGQQDFENSIAAKTLDLKDESDQRDYLLGLARIDQDQDELDERARLNDSTIGLNSSTIADRRSDNARDREKLDAQIDKWEHDAAAKDRELDLRAQGKIGDGRSRRTVNGLTAAQHDEWMNKKARLNALAKAYKAMAASGKYKGQAEITKLLRNGNRYSRDELVIARDMAFLGYLSSGSVATAKAYFPGQIIPSSYNIPRDPKPRG